MQMKRILFPTDFSDNALKAYRFALTIADKFKSEIIAVHVESYDQIARVAVEEEGIVIASKNQERLKRFINQPPDRAFYQYKLYPEIINIIKQGDIVEGIIKCTKEYNIDLIVMGTQGKNSTLKKIFGGVATKVLERVTCPVLLIPPEVGVLSFEEISLAINFSEKDKAALEWLIEFGAAYGSSISAVHIDQSTSIEEFRSKNNQARDFYELTDTRLPMKVIWNQSVLKGLESYIEHETPNILAIISPTRSFWELLFINSLTHQLAEQIKVPMLVIHKIENEN